MTSLANNDTATAEATAGSPSNAMDGAADAEQISVPLSKLFLSPLNRRQTTDESEVADLIASIRNPAQGLLQQLVVVEASGKREKKGTFGVVAGGRRLLALQVLARDGVIAKSALIPCRLVPLSEGMTASLSENTQRKAMHPADEYESFRALVEAGKSVEELGEAFGLSPLNVRRRLKLATISPKLIAEWRADTITLDQLMALTLSDDHATQESTWANSPSWQRSAEHLRDALTQEEGRADQDRRALFVGVEAYTAAGGTLRRDLFADHPGYLQDMQLIVSLTLDKMNVAADALRADGWKNVIPVTDDSTFYPHSHDFAQLQPALRTPTKAEAKAEKKLSDRIETLSNEMEALDIEADDDSDAYEKLSDEHDELRDQLDIMEAARQEWSAEQKATANVVLSLDNTGALKTTYGVIAKSQARALARTSPASFAEGEAPAPRAVHSERLVLQLTAHRSAAMQATLADDPRLALVALLQTMAPRALGDTFNRNQWLKVSVSPATRRLNELAPDMASSSAQQKLDHVRAEWLKATGLDRDIEAEVESEDDTDAFLCWLLKQDMAELLRLLAYCVAVNVDLTTTHETEKPAHRFAKAIDFDVRKWWTPTAEGYFAGLSKPAISAAVKEACGSVPATFNGMKKDAITGAAAEAIEGKGWVPELMRDA